MTQTAIYPALNGVNIAQSMLTMLSTDGTQDIQHRPTVGLEPRRDPGREPDPEPNPEPDAAITNANKPDIAAILSFVAPDDWNELFHAVQVRLMGCVDVAYGSAPQKPQLPLQEPLEVVRETVFQCVAALDQLRHELDRERSQRTILA